MGRGGVGGEGEVKWRGCRVYNSRSCGEVERGFYAGRVFSGTIVMRIELLRLPKK